MLCKKNKKNRQSFTHNYVKYTHTHTHTHTHTLYRLIGVKDNVAYLKYLELAFEGRETSRVPDVLGEIVPDEGAKM